MVSREEEGGSEAASAVLRKALVEFKARLDFPREVEDRLLRHFPVDFASA